MILPWRKKIREPNCPARIEGSSHELFGVDKVFIIAGKAVLAERVLDGYVSVGDLLKRNGIPGLGKRGFVSHCMLRVRC